MSTAAAFVFPRSFPFCVEDISSSLPAGYESYIANLTLAQVMAFAWNLETLSITTNGQATVSGDTAIGDATFDLNPLGHDNVDKGKLSDGSMWFGDSFGTEIAWASWPALRSPVERICNPSQTTPGCILELSGNSTANRYGIELRFYVGTDPVNSGKFRLYYFFVFDYSDDATETITVRWETRASLAGLTAWTSGTITIAGLTFNWYSYHTTGASLSGTGALTASSGSFTY